MLEGIHLKATVVDEARNNQSASLWSRMEEIMNEREATYTSNLENTICREPQGILIDKMKLLSDIGNGRTLKGNLRPIRQHITQADVTPPPKIEDLE